MESTSITSTTPHIQKIHLYIQSARELTRSTDAEQIITNVTELDSRI